MIHQIQRLGIAYHFASDIDHVLKQLNETCLVCNNGERDIDDLYTAEQLSPPLATQVRHALKQTIRRGVPRLEARRYISMYEAEPSHDEVLLSLAKSDFNRLQKQHHKELFDLAVDGFRLQEEITICKRQARGRYFWILGVHFEPELAVARRMMTKVIAVTSVLDDLCDVYGTYEGLELFTQAFQSLQFSVIDAL
ncbi:hypothetical protein EUGRSUZ_F03403 [Eucalyptus grandis]|uniref:Uncharacterized protein n=2 Tax=Eucalyptus grandis TaxID=71139 RepID=A0ACC3KM58_EUCGR|nr:hypothetical protein EUGRSUZ_F03403 [Eucalyptus grandis]